MFYIGCKQVEAWVQEKDGRAGYAVKYPDGYLSWSPKDTFEAAYLPVGPDGTRISPDLVDDFIVATDVRTLGGKTTVVHATLANGFELAESSSCVDPGNYDEELGATLCKRRIKDRVWFLLGFLLQSARNGVRASPRDTA